MMDQQLLEAINMGNWASGGVLLAILGVFLSAWKAEIKSVLWRRNGKVNGSLSKSTIEDATENRMLIGQMHDMVSETKDQVRSNGTGIDAMNLTLEKIETNTAIMAARSGRGHDG